jgi:peroxiredoxin
MRFIVTLSFIFFFQAILLAQPRLMLRSSDAVSTCTITSLGDPILLKEKAIAEVQLSTNYQSIVLPGNGFYFINSNEASLGFQAFENDSLFADWMDKEQRFILRGGTSKKLLDESVAVDSLCDARLLEFLKLPSIRRSKEVKYFADTLQKRYALDASNWLRNYVFYRAAYVEIVSESAPRADLMKKYFERQAEPENPAWIESFRNLYKGFLVQKMNGRMGNSLVGALREHAWTKFWNQYRDDSLSMHPEIREFAFLFGVSQLKSQNNISGISFEWTIDSLASFSEFPNVKHAALALKNEWNKYAKGADVGDFTFTTTAGKSMRLSDLQGKPVYLCYYPAFSQSTYREIAMLQAFKERYKNEIEFLVIVKNADRKGLLKALEAIKSTLMVSEFASCSQSFSALPENLNSPGYFLINKSGKFFKAPAEGPETGVEDSFLGLVKD